MAWTGPYIDNLSNVTMLTGACTAARNAKVIGEVTMDINITELEEYIKTITIGKNGYAFLVSREGFYVASRYNDKNMREKMTEEADPALADLGQRIVAADKLLFLENDCFEEHSFIMVAPLAIDNLKLVLVAPTKDYTNTTQNAIAVSVIVALIVMVTLCFIIINILYNRNKVLL